MPSDITYATPGSALLPVFSFAFGSWKLSLDRSPFEQKELATHYDKQSSHWHRAINRYGFEEAYHRLMGKILRQHRYDQDTTNLRVLDAGIGTGAMTSALRRLTGTRFQLDGIDISSAMLGQAAKRLKRQDVDFTLTQADLTVLPYADNTFDLVLAAHVLEHLPDPNRAIDELFRVLKPGGVLICCMTRRSWMGAYIQLVWRTHQVAQSTAKGWLRRAGLHCVRAIPLDAAPRRFSIGYVGCKPPLNQMPYSTPPLT